MTTKREAILNGVAKASELHAKLGVRQALSEGVGAIDVYGAAHQLGLLVMFRPLRGLLGAYVPTRDASGMLITTARDLHVQRFTAAHELGHHVLAHRALSLDKVVGFVGRGETSTNDLQEVEADAFAAEFLLPKWLVVAHVNRQGWSTKDLAQQDIAYQLSLRLGASYSATCWALLSHNILTRTQAMTLEAAEPKAAKRRALPGPKPSDWHRDIWVLSEKDKGAHLIGGPEDMIVVSLNEHIAGGYAWDESGIKKAGMNLHSDDRLSAADNRLGGGVRRRFIMQGQGQAHLHLEERRPWDSSQESIDSFEVDLTLVGREAAGLPRAGRQLAA